MKAVRLHETGGPGSLRIDEVPAPLPAPREAVVRLRAAALNHRDVFISRGLYPNIQLPRILGADGAGDLDGSPVLVDPTIGWGDDEAVWAPDAAILGMPHDGTFAQFVSVPRENVHAKPEHLSYEEAAALPLAGVTAYRALFTRGRLRAEETILITGVGGGVQTFVLLFAKAVGARVIATSGNDEKLARAKKLGADVTLNYRTVPDWHKAARQAAGRIDIAVDSAGGDTFARVLTIVRPGGRIVTYGGTTGDAAVKLFPVFWNQLTVYGTSMGSPQDFRAMLDFVNTHRIRPEVDRVYGIDQVVSAAERMDSANQFGKIVLRVH